MKFCYKLKMHRGIDGMFAFSSGLCYWTNKDSGICSCRQLLLPMTSGLWKSTPWPGLASVVNLAWKKVVCHRRAAF